jgi:hypothetical protein
LRHAVSVILDISLLGDGGQGKSFLCHRGESDMLALAVRGVTSDGVLSTSLTQRRKGILGAFA